MVGTQGFEPWTSTASGWRSPPELRAYIRASPKEECSFNSNAALCQAIIAVSVRRSDPHKNLSCTAIQLDPPQHVVQSGNDRKRNCDPLQGCEPRMIQCARDDAVEQKEEERQELQCRRQFTDE